MMGMTTVKVFKRRGDRTKRLRLETLFSCDMIQKWVEFLPETFLERGTDDFYLPLAIIRYLHF